MKAKGLSGVLLLLLSGPHGTHRPAGPNIIYIMNVRNGGFNYNTTGTQTKQNQQTQ